MTDFQGYLLVVMAVSAYLYWASSPRKGDRSRGDTEASQQAEITQRLAQMAERAARVRRGMAPPESAPDVRDAQGRAVAAPGRDRHLVMVRR